jgi:hypothetical protein
MVLLFAQESVAQTTLGCTTGGPGGAFPTSGTGDGTYPTTMPTFPLSVTLNVPSTPPGATAVTEVKLFGLLHTYTNDVQIVLEDPAGVKHNLWCRPGGACDFSGDYVVTGIGVGTVPFPACTATLVPTGSYQQTFTNWPDGTNGIFNTNLSNVAPQVGDWKLHFYDWVAVDIGSLVSWDICFGTPPPPPPPPPTPCNGSELDICPGAGGLCYSAGNGGANGGQLFFNINVTNAAGIDVSQLDLHSDDNVGMNFTVDIHTCPTTYVGNDLNAGAWTLRASGTGTLAGLGQPSLAEFPDFHLAPGSYGVSLIFTSGNAGHSYTNGNGTNQNFSNADLSFTAGAAHNVPWTGTLFSIRVFNGTIRYNCTYGPPPPVVFCTAGTSTNGCVPSISASAQPSASLANACVVNVANVEGAKSGLLFYGIDNTGFTPTQWGVGGNSFLCVKAPTQRMSTQNSGGTAGQCDGSLAQDWNVFQTANPTALGNPFVAGDDVFVQAWYRDPPAVKTTNLSDAVQLTMQP